MKEDNTCVQDGRFKINNNKYYKGKHNVQN